MRLATRFAPRTATFASRSVVTLSYDQLARGEDLSAQIHEAYGPNGLGVLTISGVPEFAQLRRNLLPMGRKLAYLPKNELAALEHPASLWNAGWSHGHEKMGDEPDVHKGSFYANPLYDVMANDKEIEKYPFFYPKNIWPKQSLPELAPAFKKLGANMYQTVLLLCKQIDRLTEKNVPTYKKGSLFQQLQQTRKIKGRLLYYFPVDAAQASEDGWIGWHNDSGFLTALTSAMFFDDETGQEISNPDPNGGLWIVDRQSAPVKVNIPADHMAVQCGECLQIMTGGLLVATPHSVRPSIAYKSNGQQQRIGRAAFPVFIDTPADFALQPPPGVSRDQVFDRTTSSKVPPLQARWKRDGVPFIQFLGDTFEQYYAWAKQGQGKY